MAINAFVGHSFTSDDDAVVGNFISFFDQLQELIENFTWTHAQKAEPTELATKVKQSLEGCNTFIAICTRKEMVINEASLSPLMWSQDKLKGSKSDYYFKTSDWVIQELGLAIGRGMNLILLLEDGCRKPGGLQGDIEYIPFDRSAPEKSFGKLLEMLTALNSVHASGTPQPQAAAGDDEISDKNIKGSKFEGAPDSSWDVNDFENSYFWALIKKDYARIDEIKRIFVESVHAKDDEVLFTWFARTANWNMTWGKGGQISEIRNCAEKYPKNAKILTALATALGSLEQHIESAEIHLRAAECEPDSSEAARRLASAASQFMQGGQRNRANQVLESIKSMDLKEKDLRIAEATQSLGQVKEDAHLRVEAMEAIARIKPDDYDNRFSLAYAHSQLGDADMALYHYLKIPSAERNPIAWNNLGVAYENVSILGRAISAYKTAADLGETLAMSNLAYRYMDAGFFDEASAEIKKAMETGEPHRNVGEAHAKLADKPEEESKSLKEVEKRIERKSELFQRLSESVIKNTIKILPRDWIGPRGPVSIELDDDLFVAKWTYSIASNALLGVLSGVPRHYEVEIRGTMLGTRVVGHLTETRTQGEPSFLGDVDRERNVVIIFSDDLISATVTERLQSRVPTSYEWSVQPVPLA